MIVLDASAAIAMVSGAPEGEAFRALVLEGEWILAPEFFKYEVLNVIRKYVQGGYVTQETARRWYAAAEILVDEFQPLGDMAVEVLGESLSTGHPSYDLAYLVLARRTGSTIFTLDKRLADVCMQRGVDCASKVPL